MPRPSSSYYLSEEWLELRDVIVRRDGHRCRNCGHPHELEVHHWLPLPEYQDTVDGGGYGTAGNPLIVHESGLISLCKDCHEALTAIRTKQAILRNSRLEHLATRPAEELHNIFQLWALGGEKLPFRVVKDGWSEAVDQFYLVSKIEIGKWPYGFAWGRYCRNGELAEQGKIPNSGTYKWKPYKEPVSDSKSTGT